jgi:sentrin-specific protease 1
MGLQWLNDEIINFYFNLIAEQVTIASHSIAYPMSSFFYLKLMEAGYNGVRRWTSKIDLLAFDVILIPIHSGLHWCLAVIDCKKKEFMYYDSLGGRNQSCLSRLR